MTKMYYINTNLANKDTGPEINQSFKMKDDYQYEIKTSVRNLVRDKFPDFVPDLDYFQLHKRAKITDVISIGSTYFGFLVNQRVKSLIEKSRLPNYRFYEAKIGYNDNEVYDGYFFFHLVSNFLDQVDFNKTQFYELKVSPKENLENFPEDQVLEIKEQWKGGNVFWVKVRQEVNSPKELLDKNKQLKMRLLTDKYNFKNDFKIEYDLFYIGRHDIRMYTSENFAKTIKSEKITGIDFAECNWL